MRSVYMAKRYLSVFVFFACILELLAFNLDLKDPIIHGGKTHTGEYFGYSVALDSWGANLQTEWSWPLLVGAPLGNRTSDFSVRNRHGSLFRCSNDPSTSTSCSVVPVDPTDPQNVDLNGQKYDLELKIGQMLGATIESKKGKFVVCAPRFNRLAQPTSRNKDRPRKRFLVGKCFYFQDNQKKESSTFSPCYEKSKSSNPERQMCQAGFSAGISADGNVVSMGLPGFKGTISFAFATEASHYLPFATFTGDVKLDFGDMMGYAMTMGYFTTHKNNAINEEIVGSSPRADKFRGKVVIFGITPLDEIEVLSAYPKESDNIQEGSYFGSSLCGVDLNNDGPVLWFSDLLVGAPTYTEKRDEGRVYVYMNNKNGALNMNKDMILKGDNKQDARFGFSIAAVGDLNQDDFQDVAVGAPYEDGVGAVYVYLGSANGINLSPKARQKIVGSRYKVGLKSFGFSVAGGVDVDKNGFPDIAVGAVQSDQAMVLRTRPIIIIQGVVKLSTRQIVLENNDAMCPAKDKTMHKCIDVTVCFSFSKRVSGKTSAAVDVSYSVDLDKNIAFRRLFIEFANDSSREFSYKANFSLGTETGKEKCDTKKRILLQQPKQIGDLVNPLTFDLTYDLNNPSSCSPNLCPVLDVLSGDSYRAEARFLKHCRNQQICHPDLAVTGNVTFRGRTLFYNKIFIGLVDTMFVNLKVRNNDDDAAYSSEVAVAYPPGLSYIGPGSQDIQCETRKSKGSTWQQAVCKVGNPLRGRNQRDFYIEFATVGILGNISDFDLQVEAKSASDEASYDKHQDNKILLTVNVANEADLSLDGFSEPDQVVYRNSAVRNVTWVSQIGVQVLQKLIVKNRGPSSVDGAAVTISVPTRYDAKDPKSHLLYLTRVEVRGGSCKVKTNSLNLKQGGNATVPVPQQSKATATTKSSGVTKVDCKSDPSRCLTFTCKLGQLSQGDSTVIEMYSRFWQGTLYKVGVGAVDLETYANVTLPPGVTEPTNGLKNNEIQIVMRANPESVVTTSKSIQWWIVLLAVLAALIVLAGAIFVMYKKGFFQRKKPPSEDTPKDAAATTEETVPMSKPFPADADC